MTAATLANQIAEALCDHHPDVNHTLGFREAGVMTSNEGIVVRMDDGTEFQITVVKSRSARN